LESPFAVVDVVLVIGLVGEFDDVWGDFRFDVFSGLVSVDEVLQQFGVDVKVGDFECGVLLGVYTYSVVGAAD
jgi:hypothetical protein